MKPEVDQILNLSAGQIMTALAPLLPVGYAQATAGLTSFMMMFAAQEYDRAADIRASENAEMRALFRELAPQAGDASLKQKLESAAATKDESLKISALNEANSELRKLLIALQAHFETLKEKHDARARIWAMLKTAAERRLLKLPGA
jgi:hypothetical protein